MFGSLVKNLFKKEREEEIKKIKQEAKEITLKAQEEALKTKKEAEIEARKIVEKSLDIEGRLSKKEDDLGKREKELHSGQQSLKDKEIFLDKKKKEYEMEKDKIVSKLEKISGLTKDEAKKLLLSAWEDKLKGEIAKKIKEANEEVEKSSEEKAKEVLMEAMRYGATDYVSEYTLASISLPNDDYKGRIIGKDGRNIRAFELATGVDVDLEEEGLIRISSFDAVRREVAKISMKKLIKDGRIQPHRIEEIVDKVRKEVDDTIYKAGKDLVHRVGAYNIPNELVKLLGHFRFRYSYGQNMILHTLEETKIGVAIAHEIGADVGVVKVGCLLHDIGKVVTDKEGSHVDLGVELLKKHGFNEKIIGCVEAHHEDVPFPSVEAVIVYIADAVSGGRPGARHEDFQEYLKRIKTIEDAALSHKGVKDAYALQAGRELRVIVKPDQISDDEATIMASKIKEELEKKFDVFPGQIKITVIREYRAEDTAKYN